MVDYKTIAKKWDFNKTVSKFKDTKNFEINKQGRFAARFFQIALAVISYYFIAVQKKVLWAAFESNTFSGSLMLFAICSPILSGFLIAIYIFPWFSKKWTSRRILSVETFCDVLMTISWAAIFFVGLASVGGKCANPTDASWVDGCGNYNWLMAWIFFLFLSFAAGVYFDGTAWYNGVWKGPEIESDVLLDIRRTTRTTNRYK
ncbi:hypothetical protein EDD86DRAFT_197370 [Gorgonomyces haynaldii]|nr:hypothetical protein EDD86DRAFT_197370 [Gorgonomyces haynaldii]